MRAEGKLMTVINAILIKQRSCAFHPLFLKPSPSPWLAGLKRIKLINKKFAPELYARGVCGQYLPISASRQNLAWRDGANSWLPLQLGVPLAVTTFAALFRAVVAHTQTIQGCGQICSNGLAI